MSKLPDDERAALLYNLLYRTHAKKNHPELFGKTSWDPRFYNDLRRGEDALKSKGMLDEYSNPTDKAYQILSKKDLRWMLQQFRDQVIKLELEKSKMTGKIHSLENETQRHDPLSVLQSIGLPRSTRQRIEKAFERINEESFSEAILNCYLISESSTKSLFNFLYPNEKNKRMKHEDRLKKIWNDEGCEKHKHSGIRVISSLFAVILWYRNKMAAHAEMIPTRQAARTCVVSLIQALVEFNRLGIKIASS